MCYGTRIVREAKQLELYYNVDRLYGEREIEGELSYHYSNGWNHNLMWIIPQERKNRMVPSMWGIIPSNKKGEDYKNYYNEAARFGAGLNAQSEKLFDHFIYQYSAMTKRCIIPVDGFFEPHTAPNKFKVPFYFSRENEALLSLAGLYTTTKDGYNTFTILTKPATPLFSKIHNQKFRRPVILNDEDIDVWLDDSLNENEILNVIEDDMPDIALSAYPISKELYSPKVDSNIPDVIKQVDYSEIQIDY